MRVITASVITLIHFSEGFKSISPAISRTLKRNTSWPTRRTNLVSGSAFIADDMSSNEQLKSCTDEKILSLRGGKNDVTYALSLLPSIALSLGAAAIITAFLRPLDSAAAQGIKLVFAGAVAGIISRSFCAPLEMVSTVMMCKGDECVSMVDELERTWKEEGLRGMFKGNGANCLKVAPSRGSQFLFYELLKKKFVLMGWGVGAAASLNAGARLVAGGIAGMFAACIVYPLEVVKTMLTLYPDQCGSIFDAFKLIIKNGGIGGLYRGLPPTLIAMFPYVGVEFMVYETLKKRYELIYGPAGVAAQLLIGAIGGAAAQASAHPLDVIRRRMQMQNMNKGENEKEKVPKKYSNMFTGMYRVAKEEGWHALFNGLGPACFEKVPSTAIGYYIYEGMKVAVKVASV